MFHLDCWKQTCEKGPAAHASSERDQRGRQRENFISCPNCRGRGHAIACWRYMDPNISTQVLPTGRHQTSSTDAQAPNLLDQVVTWEPSGVARPLQPISQRDTSPQTSSRGRLAEGISAAFRAITGSRAQSPVRNELQQMLLGPPQQSPSLHSLGRHLECRHFYQVCQSQHSSRRC